jgi:hypothetical protein
MSQTPIFKRSSDIAKHLSCIVEGITLANGYKTDIGKRVFRGKWKHDEDLVPYAVVFVGPDSPSTHRDLRDVLIEQDFVLAGYVECDPDNPNDAADDVVSDLKKAIFTSDLVPAPPAAGNRGIGAGRVKSVSYTGKEIGARSDGADKTFVYGVVRITVSYAEDLTDA